MPSGGKQTKSLKKLAEYYAAADPGRAAQLSITEVAAAAGVSEATVLRFCRSLGFGGYPSFRLRLAQGNLALFPDREQTRLDDLEQKYRGALSECRTGLDFPAIRAAAKDLFCAESVCCFGAGSASGQAIWLHERLLGAGIRNSLEGDLRSLKMRLGLGGSELVVLLSDAENAEAREAAALARAAGKKVLFFTRGGEAAFADVVLRTESDVSFLMTLDLLFEELSREIKNRKDGDGNDGGTAAPPRRA